MTEDGAGAGIETAVELPEGTELIEAPFGGVVWKLLVAPGETVASSARLAVMEAMKMEFPLETPGPGTIEAVFVSERQSIQPGAPMFALRRAS